MRRVTSIGARAREAELMFFGHDLRTRDFALLSFLLGWAGIAAAGEPPRVLRHVVVYREPGRFAGWPANHGIWSWGDEVLVGFSRGYDKDRGPYHHIDHDKPEEHLLARSRDGGLTWSVEEPRPKGALAGTPGMRHGTMPVGLPEETPSDLREPIDFTHADFALTVRMENANNGVSRFDYSYDRGKTWRGPFRLPLFGQIGVMGRTDFLVNGPRDCLLFLTASKANGREGRPFGARTTDGGLTWQFVSFIGPEPSGYAIMPSTVRLSATDLLTTVRRKDAPKSWIDAYASRDDGHSWSLLSTPEPDTGEGNPPSLIPLPDGRLCLTYGVRARPFGIRARLSSSHGDTWSNAVVLRDDGSSNDLGYVRSVVRPDGKVVALYYFSDQEAPERYLGATIWDPGTP
jgi:BNR repeat-like domain